MRITKLKIALRKGNFERKTWIKSPAGGLVIVITEDTHVEIAKISP